MTYLFGIDRSCLQIRKQVENLQCLILDSFDNFFNDFDRLGKLRLGHVDELMILNLVSILLRFCILLQIYWQLSLLPSCLYFLVIFFSLELIFELLQASHRVWQIDELAWMTSFSQLERGFFLSLDHLIVDDIVSLRHLKQGITRLGQWVHSHFVLHMGRAWFLWLRPRCLVNFIQTRGPLVEGRLYCMVLESSLRRWNQAWQLHVASWRGGRAQDRLLSCAISPLTVDPNLGREFIVVAGHLICSIDVLPHFINDWEYQMISCWGSRYVDLGLV